MSFQDIILRILQNGRANLGVRPQHSTSPQMTGRDGSVQAAED